MKNQFRLTKNPDGTWSASVSLTYTTMIGILLLAFVLVFWHEIVLGFKAILAGLFALAIITTAIIHWK